MVGGDLVRFERSIWHLICRHKPVPHVPRGKTALRAKRKVDRTITEHYKEIAGAGKASGEVHTWHPGRSINSKNYVIKYSRNTELKKVEKLVVCASNYNSGTVSEGSDHNGLARKSQRRGVIPLGATRKS